MKPKLYSLLGVQYIALIFFSFQTGSFLFGQDTYSDTLNCSGGTPTYVVDLTAAADSLWISDPTERGGSCCFPADNNCVQFSLTLADDAAGIIFYIPDGCGAAPGGALFYQVDCGPPTSIGTPLCLDGPGPYTITFCKPGSNENCYAVKSIPAPESSEDVTITDACIDTLWIGGLDEATIGWTSIFPGAMGDYDYLLDCVAGCDTVVVEAVLGGVYPELVKFQVCGMSIGGCSGTPFCDTVSVSIVPLLDVVIEPEEPTICYGGTGIDLTAIPSGGADPYSYLWNTGDTTSGLYVSEPGIYFVEILDGTGCSIAMDTVEVTEYLEPITADAGPDLTFCAIPVPAVALNGVITGSTTAIWTGGMGTFAPDDVTLDAVYTPTPEELLAGFVNLILTTTDNGSCPGDADTLTINFSVFTTLIESLVNDVDCFGNATGAIDITAIGGALPLTYGWDTGAIAEDLAGLLAGDYTLVMIDTNGCEETMDFTVSEPPLLTESATTASISCFGFTDGFIDVSPEGGTPGYAFLWDTGAITEDLDGIAAGIYTFIITDANGCELPGSYTLIEPAELIVTNLSEDVTCYDFLDGSIDVTTSGGVAGYSYLWNTGAITEDLAGLGDGLYLLTVTDANGCETPIEVLISEPTALELTSVLSDIPCFGGLDGTIDITTTGGTVGYTYLWDSGEITEDRAGLPAGTYAVDVTDANGCIISGDYTLTEPPLLTLDLTGTDILCFGDSTGSIGSTVAGGVPGYSYLWNTGATTPTIATLIAGTYDLTVTDANGCTMFETITLTEPSALIVTYSSEDVTCYDFLDGSIDVTTSGGVAGYSYLWNTGAITEDLAGIVAGTYSLTVTDANGCETSIEVLISEPTALELTGVFSDIPCFGGLDGTIDLTTTGGTVGYTYLWDSGEITEDRAGLPAGTYAVDVTDANGCIISGDYTLTEPPLLTLDLTGTNIACFGDSTGSIGSTVAGGAPGYSYLWNTGATTPTIATLMAGTYDLTVTDANGCTMFETITLTEPSALVVTYASEDVTCYDFLDGSIDVSTSGGVAGYSYLWNTGAITEDLAGIVAGTYSLTVTDANGCETPIEVLISEPTALELTSVLSDIPCFGGLDGTIDITTTGGTVGYTYLWDSGEITEDRAGLPAGTYAVDVTDANGCIISGDYTLTEPPLLTLDLTGTNIACFGDSTGSIGSTVAGGAPGYSYLWNTGATTPTIATLMAGTYDLTVTDANGCEMSNSIGLSQPSLLLITIDGTDEICVGSMDGTADLEVAGGVAPYSYEWEVVDITVTDEDLVGLGEGTYVVEVLDDNGCPAMDSVSIGGPIDFDAGPDSTFTACSGDGIVNMNLYLMATTDGVWSESTASGHFNAETAAFDLNDLPAGDYVFNYIIPVFTPCTDTIATFIVTVYPKPVVNFTADEVMGCAPLAISFSNLTAYEGSTCVWNMGDGTIIEECGPINHSYDYPGDYDVTLEITSDVGCISEFTAESFVHIYDNPEASFTYLPAFPSIQDPEVAFTNTSVDDVTRVWSFGDGSPLSTIDNPNHMYPTIGNEDYDVVLIVTNDYGCVDTAMQNIVIEDVLIYYVPNVFTPDGDDYNNVFKPVMTAGYDIYNYRLTIFNRWGELIFESMNADYGWSGTYGGGDLVDDGVYIWLLEFTETASTKTHTVEGHVTLLK